MNSRIWVFKKDNLYTIYEDGEEAEKYFKDAPEGTETGKYVLDGVDVIDTLKTLQEDYARLQTEAESLRDALTAARENAESQIKSAEEAARVARSDTKMLEETVIKMAMRMVGVWN